MPNRKTKRLFPVLLLGAVLVSGCVSVLPEPEAPSALITLPDSRAQAPSSPLRADVQVFPPDSIRSFAGMNLAVRNDDAQELVFLSGVRFADTAPRLMQGAVVNALSKATGQGHAAPAELATHVDYDLRWRLQDFSVGKKTNPVRVAVEVSLVDSKTRRMIAQQRFEKERTPNRRSERERAAALALAAQDVANEVANFVARTATPKN